MAMNGARAAIAVGLVGAVLGAAALIGSRSEALNHPTSRSPRWRAVEARHLEIEPTCAACGSRTDLNVHHVKPFHLFPELELEDSNLITLCRSHHFVLGHDSNWRKWNPDVRRDCEKLRSAK